MSEWVESLSSEGKIYFYNKKTGESRWTDPVEDSIPKEKCWIMLSDADGHNFYFNTSTKESTWKKPDSYDQRHDMEVRIKRERQDFFIMLSSSVPKDLNLNEITQRTPAIYTMKELSSRFDTDPRLINTPQIRRERYLDEWVQIFAFILMSSSHASYELFMTDP